MHAVTHVSSLPLLTDNSSYVQPVSAVLRGGLSRPFMELYFPLGTDCRKNQSIQLGNNSYNTSNIINNAACFVDSLAFTSTATGLSLVADALNSSTYDNPFNRVTIDLSKEFVRALYQLQMHQTESLQVKIAGGVRALSVPMWSIVSGEPRVSDASDFRITFTKREGERERERERAGERERERERVIEREREIFSFLMLLFSPCANICPFFFFF